MKNCEVSWFSANNLLTWRCCSIAKSCPTLCDPMDCSTPGLPVLHRLPGFAQTRVHRVSDAIQHLILCHPLVLLPSIFPSIRVSSNEPALCLQGKMGIGKRNAQRRAVTFSLSEQSRSVSLYKTLNPLVRDLQTLTSSLWPICFSQQSSSSPYRCSHLELPPSSMNTADFSCSCQSVPWTPSREWIL